MDEMFEFVDDYFKFMDDNRKLVADGAQLLDVEMPGWYTQINPQVLNIASGMNCILGQVFHQLWIGSGNISPFEYACVELEIEHRPEAFGFDVDYDIADGEYFRSDVDKEAIFNFMYSTLAELWIDEVKMRFEKGI